jgi:glycosyltransferase involved in cell wall biosynthesis
VREPGASPLPAAVVDGRTRTLRPPLGPDPEKLAGAVVRLLHSSRLRRQLGERARERVKEIFGLDRYVRDLERVYIGDL